MQYIVANHNQLNKITELVQNTIETVYSKYYPKEVVKFFLNHHSMENIARDIDNELVGILMVDGKIVGTGCYNENHITRVYVLPEFQSKGYGSYIINHLESIISEKYDYVLLDASLPACTLYEHRGYKTVGHGKWKCDNDVVLVYEVMKKGLTKI